MKWIHQYQLYLFDFDGILVNTEDLHYKAYIKMCANRGFSLKWDMQIYIKHAMYSATGIKEGIYREFPELYRAEPRWEILYKEKKIAYRELLETEGVQLMPGVKDLLKGLQEADLKRCVVTHSPQEQIALIRKQNPILDTIPHWITREDYSEPKPSPECYRKAIEIHAQEGDQVIGFEDSPRGLKALLGTEAEACLVTNLIDEDEVLRLSRQFFFTHYPSFSELFASKEG